MVEEDSYQDGEMESQVSEVGAEDESSLLDDNTPDFNDKIERWANMDDDREHWLLENDFEGTTSTPTTEPGATPPRRSERKRTPVKRSDHCVCGRSSCTCSAKKITPPHKAKDATPSKDAPLPSPKIFTSK
jgi:hypothetical protein